MNQQVVIKAGYLKKQTMTSGAASLLRRPTRRWFVFLLFGGLPSLEYFEDAASTARDAPINSFDLRGCRQVTRNAPGQCSFLVTLADRVLTLTAETEAEANEWADTLDRNLGQLSGRQKPINIYGTLGDDDDDDYEFSTEDSPGARGNGKDGKSACKSKKNGHNLLILDEETTALVDTGDPDNPHADDIEGLKEMERRQSLRRQRRRDAVAQEMQRLEARLRERSGEAGVQELRAQLGNVYGNCNGNDVYEEGFSDDSEDGNGKDRVNGTNNTYQEEEEVEEMDAMAAELEEMDPAAFAVMEAKYRELEDWDALTRLATRRNRSALSAFRPNPDPPPYQHLVKPILVSGFFDRKADISVEETESGQFVVNTLGPGGPRLSPLCASVERLKRQILHAGGLQLNCSPKDLLNSVAVVQCAGRLWIAGWNARDAPRLHGCLHVGDQLIGLDGFRLESLDHMRRILQGSASRRVALRLRRLPHGKAFCVRRSADGQSLGLVTAGHTAEVAHVRQDGLAAAHGLAYRTPGIVDDANFTTWTLTEVNGRPLSLWPAPKEVAVRLEAPGTEISLAVQPTDLVREIRAQLKKLSSYKQYVVG